MDRPRWGRVPHDLASRAPYRHIPFDDAEYAARWARVAGWLEAQGLDAMVAVASPGDSAMTRWLANYESYVGQTAVVVTARGAAAVATNSLMRAEPMHSGVWMSPVADVRPAGNRRYMPDAKTLEQLVGEILADHVPRAAPRIALAGPASAAMQRAFPDAVESTPALAELMAVKSPAEVALLRRCNAAADAMLEAAMRGLEAGKSEHALAGEVFHAMMAAGAEGPAVPLALVAGPRSGLKHVGPTDYRMREGDLFFIDVGPFVEGYAADISRSGVVGRPDAEQRRFLDCGVEMTAAAVAVAGPGVAQAALDDAAFTVAREYGFAEDYYFRAHGVGTALFLPPRFNPGDRTPLRAGEVFSLEPMLVRLGYGCACVERTLLVTETGVELLDRQAPAWW